jgi:hypothetical protein
MQEAVAAETYLELFGGTGARSIKPLYGRCKITTTEIVFHVRRLLEKTYPDLEVYPRFEVLQHLGRTWELVSADPPIGLGIKGRIRLSTSVVLPFLKKWATKGIITYVPLDIRAYIERCGDGMHNVGNLEADCLQTFGTLDTTPELLADYFGGELIALREGTATDLAYCGIKL